MTTIREEVSHLLESSTHPERIKALQDVIDLIDYRRNNPSNPKEKNKRKSLRNMAVNREFIERSTTRRKWYTESELALVRDLSIPIKEVARQLGRTPRGIEFQRRKLKRSRVVGRIKP